jgi:hypothetical protein
MMDSVDWIHLAHGTRPQVFSCEDVNRPSGSKNWRKCDSQIISVFTEESGYGENIISVLFVTQ